MRVKVDTCSSADSRTNRTILANEANTGEINEVVYGVQKREDRPIPGLS